MLYHYQAELLRVIDGDTVDMSVDLGFQTHVFDKFRLAHINAPELSTQAGLEAKKFLEALLAGKLLEVETIKDREDKFGRMLAVIWASELGKSQLNVNQAMIDSGHAVKYEGGKRSVSN